MKVTEEAKKAFDTLFREHSYRWDDFEIVDESTGKEIRLAVQRMYEYVPFGFGILKKISEIFGTDLIDTDNYSRGGCETCDWGSLYKITFIIKEPTKGVEK